jgi:hypothetical protein
MLAPLRHPILSTKLEQKNAQGEGGGLPGRNAVTYIHIYPPRWGAVTRIEEDSTHG